ncbi:arsenate reductase ArsC [Nocardioides aequoreus]|uniref:arsenate reductase ArsC n=1 Tax=Nocardioides aequoreus TaxID=397278 RepID=UPI0004C2EF86|nr:arsenate reductase ArsC [Nocardioides aequoreus]
MSTPTALPEHQPDLHNATARLAEEFRGRYGSETIARLLRSSYDELLATASIVTYVPLLAERFTRERLQALARVDGLDRDHRPTVLFLCVHNAGRSQMALGFLRHLAGDGAVGWSGGSEPGARIDPLVVEAMGERGVDLAEEFPKPWTDETVRAADVVTTMGCGDACPVLPGKRYEEWELDDPAGLDLDSVRVVRDQLEQRVRRLLVDLGVEVSAPAAR